MGDLAGVIPLDADAILVVRRIADYLAGRFPPAQAHSGAKGWTLAQRLDRLAGTYAEHSRR
jgi:hypothetical protein